MEKNRRLFPITHPTTQSRSGAQKQAFIVSLKKKDTSGTKKDTNGTPCAANIDKVQRKLADGVALTTAVTARATGIKFQPECMMT